MEPELQNELETRIREILDEEGSLLDGIISNGDLIEFFDLSKDKIDCVLNPYNRSLKKRNETISEISLEKVADYRRIKDEWTTTNSNLIQNLNEEIDYLRRMKEQISLYLAARNANGFHEYEEIQSNPDLRKINEKINSINIAVQELGIDDVKIISQEIAKKNQLRANLSREYQNACHQLSKIKQEISVPFLYQPTDDGVMIYCPIRLENAEPESLQRNILNILKGNGSLVSSKDFNGRYTLIRYNKGRKRTETIEKEIFESIEENRNTLERLYGVSLKGIRILPKKEKELNPSRRTTTRKNSSPNTPYENTISDFKEWYNDFVDYVGQSRIDPQIRRLKEIVENRFNQDEENQTTLYNILFDIESKELIKEFEVMITDYKKHLSSERKKINQGYGFLKREDTHINLSNYICLIMASVEDPEKEDVFKGHGKDLYARSINSSLVMKMAQDDKLKGYLEEVNSLIQNKGRDLEESELVEITWLKEWKSFYKKYEDSGKPTGKAKERFIEKNQPEFYRLMNEKRDFGRRLQLNPWKIQHINNLNKVFEIYKNYSATKN